MGSRHSNPRLARWVPVHLSTRARPASGFPCTTGPCLVAHTGTVTGEPPRTSIRSCRTSASAQPYGVRYRVPAKRSRYRSCVSASPCVIAHATEPLEPEVREPGQPGERGPRDVEVGAGHPALPVHVRRVERPVRVVADHRAAVRGAPPADGPRVGPGLDLGEEPQVPLDVAERLVEQVGDRVRSAARRAAPRPATRGPAGSPAASKAPAPARASSTALASLCCHCPIWTCRTRYAATECHGLPRLDRVLRGQRQRAVRDGLVDPARVGLERRPQRRRHRGDVELGGGGEPEPPGEHVRAERREPGDLRPPPARPPPVVVHLEQPVLRARVPHPGPRVRRRLGPHMRHPVLVARDQESPRNQVSRTSACFARRAAVTARRREFHGVPVPLPRA